MDWLKRLARATMGPFVINIVGGGISAIPTYFLWNWLVPEIFGLMSITFWQAFGLVWLSGLLFKTPFFVRLPRD